MMVELNTGVLCRKCHRIDMADSELCSLSVLCYPGGSDLAYETMYDDDELVGKQVHTPWFDPSYLATDRKEDEVSIDTPLSYEG